MLSLKRRCTISLIFLMCISLLLPTYSFADSTTVSSDTNFTYTRNIDGTTYKYDVSGNSSESKTVITNLKQNTTDTLILKNNVFYLNGEKVGEIAYSPSENTLSANAPASFYTRASSWKKIGGPTTKPLTWKPGIFKAVVAAMIAAAIGIKAGPIVSAALGSALGYIVTTGGCKVRYTLYSRKVGRFYNYKCVWKLTTNTNVSYGYYTSYSTV